jgi:glycosidase
MTDDADHHPGPPRFVRAGEDLELAPRSPDPDASFAWTVLDAPDGSGVAVGDDPVEHVEPDVPGRYRFRLDAPDGTHDLTVRVFPDERRTGRFELPVDDLPEHDHDEVSVIGPFNDYTLGVDRPRIESDAYVYERPLAPGDHSAIFVVGDDFEATETVDRTVEGPGRPRVRLDATVEDGEVVVAAETLAPPGDDLTDGDVAVEFYLDDRDRAAVPDGLSVDGREARFDLGAVDGSVRVHAVPVGERHGVADAVSVADDGSVTRLNEPPEWAESATIYEIFTREFVGGADTTFEELERRVDYLSWLGVDVVWLTPVLDSMRRHGYHITDYFDTDDDLGSREAFESFVERCHDEGIRVVFDLVINHSSRRHPAHQMSAAGVDEYRDWYVWEDGEPAHYFNWNRIPNFNFDSLAVREFLLDVVEEWAPVVDGFRCDVAWGVPHGFWKEVRERVRGVDDEFLLLDETVPRDPEFHELEFDVHYDTTLYGRLRDIGSGDASASTLLDAARAHEQRGFPTDAVHMRYVENHDEDRYLDECDPDALRAAAAAVFSLPGCPMIYYGQERGMTEYRGPMQWTEGDDGLTRFHRRLVRTRAAEPALRAGDLAAVDWEADSDEAVAFAREHEAGRVVVCLNFGGDSAAVTVDEPVGDRDLLTGDAAAVDREGGAATVSVDDAVVLRSPGDR